MERWDVMLERGVEGGRGGREGVKRPDLGSGVSHCADQTQSRSLSQSQSRRQGTGDPASVSEKTKDTPETATAIVPFLATSNHFPSLPP